MLKAIVLSVAALAALSATSNLRAQTAVEPEGTTPVSATQAMEHREMLIAQCPAAPPRIPEADAARLPINVTRWGASGPVVLIVHGGVQGGLGGGPATFAKQEPLGSQGWQLRVVDRPGFGQSSSRGVDDMEADAVWIADMLGNGANLIGHSWGGGEALLAAARRPEAVRSLVLIEPALQLLLLSDPRIGKDPVLRADASRWGGLLLSAQTPRDYALGFAHALGAVDGGDASNTAAAALNANADLATHYGCALLQARMAPVPVLRQAAQVIAQAHIPVLVVTGGWSPFFDAVGEVTAELTGGRHVIVRSPNHFVQLSGSEEFNKVVDVFMRQADQMSSSAPEPSH